MHRDDYKKAISDAVNKQIKIKNPKSNNKYEYKKNATDNYQTMNDYGDQNLAIRHAKQLVKQYTDEKYAEHNPCTTVYKLVEELLGNDKILTEEIEQNYFTGE
jgi:hypothetical protein